MRTLSLLLVLLALSLAAFGQQAAPRRQQGRQEFEAHNYKAAAEFYRAAVAAEPDNAEALAGLIDSLEAMGQWRDSLPSLEHLAVLQPTDARRMHQLGQWRSWSGDGRGVEALAQACSMDKSNPQYCTDYAEVLAWRTETRGQAISQLRVVLATLPGYVPAMARLAEILSWSKDSRVEAAGLFEAALKLDPKNVHLLDTYAEMLTYDRSQRPHTLSLYARALSIDAADARALTGKAQLLAWTGHSADAMELYDRVLSADPGNIAALRGKGQILNWRGNYADAYVLLRRAQSYAPEDRLVSAELARTQLGMHHYEEAQRIIDSIPTAENLDGVRGELERAVGPWVETGVDFRRNADNLNYDRAAVAVSTLVGPQNRLVFRYTPTHYSIGGSNFNSNNYGAQLESQLSDKLSLTTVAAADTYPGIPSEITGGMEARYRIHSSAGIQAGFNRAPIDDTQLSLRGVETAGGLTGQVTSNLLNLGADYRNRKHAFDGSIHYTDGVYLGSGLDSNRRWAVDGNFGKAVSGNPYIRLAYGFAYAQFQYDADAPAPLPNQSGGYFSPTRYLLNYAGVTVSHKFSRRFELEATATAGAQNLENSTSSFGDAAFAGSFTGRLLWRPTARDEVRVRYDYLNVFNAFHRHLPGISWRHYF
jgi:tetratricopeptide (TPR) repeat protein